MKFRHFKIASIIILSVASLAFGIHRIDFRNGKNKNVCKDFRNEVLVYFIFIDTKETAPWTEFDIRSTLDSVGIAINWLKQKATENNVNLKIKYNYYIGNPYATVTKNLPQGTVEKTLYSSGLKQGLKDINSWSDAIAKKVGTTFNLPDKDGIPEIKNPKNKERLVAFLRDENSSESVALMFMVNNYYRNDISVPVNIFSNNDIEFAVVSYKYPSEIAHNILALYGAAPLYKSVYRKKDSKIKFAAQEFPNDIMQDPYAKKINELSIGPVTQYLIGWTDTLDNKYEKLLTDGILNF